MQARRAFTLVELSITLCLVAVLSAAAAVGMRDVIRRDAANAEREQAAAAVSKVLSQARVGLDIIAMGADPYGGGSNVLAVQVNPALTVSFFGTSSCTVMPGTGALDSSCATVVDGIYPLSRFQPEDRIRVRQLLANADIAGLRAELGRANVQVALAMPLVDNTDGPEHFDFTHFVGTLIVDGSGSPIGTTTFQIQTDADADGTVSPGEVSEALPPDVIGMDSTTMVGGF